MRRTASKLIAEHLAKQGCRHAFGMPGGEVLTLMDALVDQGIEFTLCKHENAAGFMAEGSWQATGAPGILLTTIGPGLANGVNSIANAFQEQVPLIVLSGCIADSEAQCFTHQVIDQSALLAPITKAQFQVSDQTASLVIQKAINIAKSDPPGPVHVDLPYHLADQEIVKEISLPSPVRPGGWQDCEELENAKKLLQNSKRPIILAGIGAVHHDCSQVINTLSKKHNIPIITTYKAKGIVDENSSLCLGGHGLSPKSDETILPLLAAADCIILAGYDPIEMRSGWREPWDASVAIDITHAQTEHGMHGCAIRFVGDIKSSLQTLSHANCDHINKWENGEITQAKNTLSSAFHAPDHWGPHRVFNTLQNNIPENSVVTIDSGAHRILLSQMWKCKTASSLLQSSAFCTMGVSLPLAAGYKLADPEKTVVAVVGDAGLEMVIGELASLRDFGLNIVIIVLVDGSLALIEKKQRAVQLKKSGVTFGRTDFVSLAKAYKGNGYQIFDATSLESALKKAFTSKEFSLIACEINKNEYDNAF